MRHHGRQTQPEDKIYPDLVFAQSTAFDSAIRSGRDEQTTAVTELTGVDTGILVLLFSFCEDH